MDIYRINTPEELLENNTYPGRGIIIGKTPDGKKAMTAYFIMGRSENSRNRIFTEKNGEVFTEPFDAAKVQDPSLIIYAAIRTFENNLIVTNGNQTDTIYDGLKDGKCFSCALESREFEPDGPNFTPRISGAHRHLRLHRRDDRARMERPERAEQDQPLCPLCGPRNRRCGEPPGEQEQVIKETGP